MIMDGALLIPFPAKEQHLQTMRKSNAIATV